VSALTCDAARARTWFCVNTATCLDVNAEIWSEVRTAMPWLESPDIALALIAAMSPVENVASMSELSAAVCRTLRLATC
jgi:hypothetical protein